MTMLLAFAVLTARAQAGKFFDIDHLRSGLFINQLYIDRNGFLWAVTSNGIVQYDGYQFQVFKRGQKNAAGMETTQQKQESKRNVIKVFPPDRIMK